MLGVRGSFCMVGELPGAATAKIMSRLDPLPMASVVEVPFSQVETQNSGGTTNNTFCGGLQQVMPFLPARGPMQSNSCVFGASMTSDKNLQWN